MPTTPLGIVYPCSGATIDCDDLAAYAQSTQDAISNTQALITSVLRPPAVWVRRPFGGGQVIAPGVTTVMSYTEEMYDTAGMFSLGSPTLLVVRQAGTYLVNCQTQRTSSPATLTSSRAAILLNGVEQAYQKADGGTSAFNTNDPQYVSAMLASLVVGDQITTTCLFTGTGNMGMAHIVSATRISTF